MKFWSLNYIFLNLGSWVWGPGSKLTNMSHFCVVVLAKCTVEIYPFGKKNKDKLKCFTRSATVSFLLFLFPKFFYQNFAVSDWIVPQLKRNENVWAKQSFFRTFFRKSKWRHNAYGFFSGHILASTGLIYRHIKATKRY